MGLMGMKWANEDIWVLPPCIVRIVEFRLCISSDWERLETNSKLSEIWFCRVEILKDYLAEISLKAGSDHICLYHISI
jgi:hypothetical protein